MADTKTTTSALTTEGFDRDTFDKQAFLKIVDKAAKGDTKALAEMRALCKAHPELWDIIGTDITGVVRDAHLKLLTGEDAVMREGVNRQLGKMKRDILGANPTPLERLLVERICACWVQVQYAEWIYATKTKGGVTLTHGDFLQRQMDRANHRYMAAIRALAQIRRLSAPMVQVNVAEKQVNVATPQVTVAPDAAAGMMAPPSTSALATGDAMPLAKTVEERARECVPRRAG